MTAETDDGDTTRPGRGRGRASGPDDGRSVAGKPGGGRPGDGEPGDGEPGAETARPVAPEPPLTQQIGRIAVGIAAVLFGVFAVVNAQFVSFDWIFGETTAEFSDAGEHLRGGVPLIVLLVASFLLGTLVGWVGAWWWRRNASRRQRDRSD